jgi:O-antigen/teichoic acid export membrane protein
MISKLKQLRERVHQEDLAGRTSPHAASGETLMRVARNTLFVLIARGTDVVIALFSTMLIARYLGVTDFGHFAIVTATSLFLGPVADFGFERIITREIARDKQIADRYLGAAIVARIGFSILIIALLAAVTRLADWDPKVEQAIYLSTFAQLFTSMGMLAVGTFRAFERMEFEVILNFAGNVVYIGLLCAVIAFDGGFLLVFAARLVASLMQMVLLMSVAVHTFVKPVLVLDRKLLSHIFREAAPLGIFAVLITAVFRLDVFVLNHFKGPLDVSMFEAGHRIIMQLQVIPMSIMIALFPFLSMVAVRSLDALKDSYTRAFKLLLILSLPLPIVMTFASDSIISVLYGQSFAPAAASLSVLSWTLTSLFLILLQNAVITANGRQVVNTIIAAIAFAVNLLLALFLVPRYGFLGASYAALISYALLFVLAYYFLWKTLGVPRVRDVFPKPLFAAATAGFAAFLLSGRGNGFFTALAAVLIVIIYGAALYAVKTYNTEEFAAIKNLLLRKRKKRDEQLEQA